MLDQPCPTGIYYRHRPTRSRTAATRQTRIRTYRRPGMNALARPRFRATNRRFRRLADAVSGHNGGAARVLVAAVGALVRASNSRNRTIAACIQGRTPSGANEANIHDWHAWPRGSCVVRVPLHPLRPDRMAVNRNRWKVMQFNWLTLVRQAPLRRSPATAPKPASAPRRETACAGIAWIRWSPPARPPAPWNSR